MSKIYKNSPKNELSALIDNAKIPFSYLWKEISYVDTTAFTYNKWDSGWIKWKHNIDLSLKVYMTCPSIFFDLKIIMNGVTFRHHSTKKIAKIIFRVVNIHKFRNIFNIE